MASLARSEVGKDDGFTLIELLVVVSMLGILATIAYISMAKLQSSTETRTSIDRLIHTIQNQRIYTMLGGSVSGERPMSYGVYFEEGGSIYTTFVCDDVQTCTYVPLQGTNTQESLEPGLKFADVALPGNQVIFIPLSGEVADYSPSEHEITVVNDSEGTTTQLSISALGTVQEL